MGAAQQGASSERCVLFASFLAFDHLDLLGAEDQHATLKVSQVTGGG